MKLSKSLFTIPSSLSSSILRHVNLFNAYELYKPINTGLKKRKEKGKKMKATQYARRVFGDILRNYYNNSNNHTNNIELLQYLHIEVD